MVRKEDNTETALQTHEGNPTAIRFAHQFAVTGEAADIVRTKIQAAKAAKEADFTDVTPRYWEARRGEVLVGVFLGFKEGLAVNEKTGEEQPKYFAVFHDGDRQIVAGQLALLDAMFSRQTGVAYKITCDEAVAGKAKKFTVLQFNG